MTLDRLPAWVRHLLILCVVAPLATLVGAVASDVLTAGGVTGVDWHPALWSAIDSAAVTLASGALAWIALAVTPLTRQYGMGQTPLPGAGITFALSGNTASSNGVAEIMTADNEDDQP